MCTDRGDEAKCSPAWVCVNHEYAREDVLLPLLKLLLARGFDPNGRIHDQPALHMALRSGHTECALALVRAGADVSAKAPTHPSVSFGPSFEVTSTLLQRKAAVLSAGRTRRFTPRRK